MNSTVYINGHQPEPVLTATVLFEYDLTPYINRKGDNVIAVKVDNSDQPNSRWYSGCGNLSPRLAHQDHEEGLHSSMGTVCFYHSSG